MFWERFVSLCAENNTKPNPVASQLGISSGAVTKWKAGTIPSSVTVHKIADYFHVSVDYLLGKTDDPRTSTQILEDSIKNAKGKILAHGGDGTLYVDKGFADDYYKFFPKDAPKNKYFICGEDEIINITKDEFKKIKTILFTIRN